MSANVDGVSPGSLKDLIFRPDASILTFAVQDHEGYWQLRNFTVASRHESVMFPAASAHQHYPSWSGDGKLADLHNGRDGYYEAVDVSPRSRPTGPASRTSDGAGHQLRRRALDRRHGRDQQQLTSANDDEQPAWSRDGRSVLFNRYSEGLYLYDLDRNAMVQVTARPSDSMTWVP